MWTRALFWQGCKKRSCFLNTFVMYDLNTLQGNPVPPAHRYWWETSGAYREEGWGALQLFSQMTPRLKSGLLSLLRDMLPGFQKFGYGTTEVKVNSRARCSHLWTFLIKSLKVEHLKTSKHKYRLSSWKCLHGWANWCRQHTFLPSSCLEDKHKVPSTM